MKPYSYDLRIRISNYSSSHSIRETALFREGLD
jgi:hypothetical protein